MLPAHFPSWSHREGIGLLTLDLIVFKVLGGLETRPARFPPRVQLAEHIWHLAAAQALLCGPS